MARGAVSALVGAGFLALSGALPTAAQDISDQGAGQAITMTNCLITPSRTVHLSAGRPGLLGDVLVDRGDTIKKGQRLGGLDNGLERSELEIAQQRVATTTKVALATARYNYESKRARRAAGLAKDEHISESDYQEAAVARDIAQLELAAAREEQDRAKLELDRATAMFNATELYAPFDGIVVDRHYSPGEYVDRQSILTLAALDPLYVELVTDAADYGKVTEHDVGIVLHELLNENLRAIVSVIDKSIDAASGTYRIRLALPNPDNQYPSGVKCSVQFTGEKAQADEIAALSDVEHDGPQAPDTTAEDTSSEDASSQETPTDAGL